MKRYIFGLTGVCGLGLILGLSSCGDKKTPAGNTNAGAGTAAVTPAPAGTVENKPVWHTVENPVEPAIAYSDRLLLSGDYERATTLLVGLKEHYPSATFPPAYDERLKRIQGLPEVDKTLAPHLAGFVKNDGAAFATVRDSGEDGMVILRKQIMANSDQALMKAAIDYMISKDDVPSVVTLLHRWKKGSSIPAEDMLISGLKTLISKHSGKHEMLDGIFLENLLLLVVAERSDRRRAALREVVSAWNIEAIDKSVLQGYQARLIADKTYDDIHLAELMAAIYTDHCAKNSDSFDALFGESAHDLVVSYLSPATGNSARSIAVIAQEIGPKLGLPDLNALKSELALHYTFNQPANTAYVYDPRTKRANSKLLGGLASRSIISGLEGNGIQFRGKEKLGVSKSVFKEKERRRLSIVGGGSYSFSVWVRPKLYPTKSESRKPVSCIISREAESVGLRLHHDGILSLAHPLESGKFCVAKSVKKVPAGRWSHLAAVVERGKGTITLFLNAKNVATASFPPNSRPLNSFIQKKFMLGAPGSYDFGGSAMDDGSSYIYDDYAYIGMVDELRIYARAISADEVKQIYQIHAALAQ